MPLIFYLLLWLLISVPQILGLLYFDIKWQIAFFLLSSSVALFYHYRERKTFLKIPILVGGIFLALSQTLGHLTLSSLVDNLFLISSFFIVYLLFQQKGFRNYLYIALLSFLNLALVSVAFESLLYGLFLLFYLFGLVYFFLLLAVKGYEYKPKEIYKELFKYSAVVYLFIFTFGVVLFFVLPRPQKPLFSFINRESVKPKIAFTNGVKLGQFDSVAQDNSVVFRAKVEGLKKGSLYWRGNTLETFKGNSWYATLSRYAKIVAYRGKGYIESLIINPYGDRNIFSLGYPKKVLSSSVKAYVDETKGVILAKKKIYKPARVEFTAFEKVKVKLLDRKPLLEIPQSLRPLLEEIVSKYHLKGRDYKDTLKRIKNFFSLFSYSLTNKAKNLTEFLTLYKEGNCEYFASAAALLLRYLGYPSRVVVGFYGGEYNPITGYIVVRQRQAHAWTEYLYNNSWHRFDATAFALSKVGRNPNLLEQNRLLLFWDTLNTLWLEYVIDLTASKQVKLAKKLYSHFRELKTNISPSELLLVLVAFAILSLLVLWRVLLLKLYLFRLWLLYRIRAFECKSFAQVYNLLWHKYPHVWLKEKNTLKRFLSLN